MASYSALVRRVRLWAGVVLFCYVTMHLVNHALGLLSLQTMEAGRAWFLAVWRSPVGTVALYGALSGHVALALVSLYLRQHFRMPAREAIQVVLGLVIPPLLVTHIVGTRVAHTWFGTTDSYTLVVLSFWKLRPDIGVKQVVLLTIAWLHGCIGLHFWLRFKPWYPRLTIVLYSLALLLPVLALLGFTQAGREVARLAQEAEWVAQTLRAAQVPGPAERVILERVSTRMLRGYVASVGLVLIARVVRQVSRRRRLTIRVTYPQGQEVVVPMGFSVLEASRSVGLPHASVCGGRGRCSTCRIRVISGLEFLPATGPEELRVLRRVGAPPNVRLACQLRPTQALSVIPLLPARVPARQGLSPSGELAGQERDLAVLFADLRGFTSIAEHKLPYDVVFLLNRYFDVVGRAVERAGGIVNQFTGDGVMALFGVQTEPDEACRQALAAAEGMVQGVAELSQTLVEELEAPLRMGIGIHTGPAVVGRMGHGVALYLTAVGDTVHVASRLQDLTKEYDCQLIISESMARRAGIEASRFPVHELTVRNRRDPIVIRIVQDIRELGGGSQ